MAYLYDCPSCGAKIEIPYPPRLKLAHHVPRPKAKKRSPRKRGK